MNINQQGFIPVPVLIFILVGVTVLGGAYLALEGGKQMSNDTPDVAVAASTTAHSDSGTIESDAADTAIVGNEVFENEQRKHMRPEVSIDVPAQVHIGTLQTEKPHATFINSVLQKSTSSKSVIHSAISTDAISSAQQEASPMSQPETSHENEEADVLQKQVDVLMADKEARQRAENELKEAEEKTEQERIAAEEKAKEDAAVLAAQQAKISNEMQELESKIYAKTIYCFKGTSCETWVLRYKDLTQELLEIGGSPFGCHYELLSGNRWVCTGRGG